MAAVVCIHLGRLCLFLSLFLMQDKLEQELEAVKAERMRAAIQAAADRQLADAQQQVYKDNKNQVTLVSLFQTRLTQTIHNYPMYNLVWRY